MSEYRNTEVFSVRSVADLSMGDIYLDDRGWQHIMMGHRSVGALSQTTIRETAENPTHVYRTKAHPNRYIFVSNGVQSRGGKAMNVVVEREQERARVITASPRRENKTPVVWESASAIYTDYDDRSDVYSITKGGACDNYADDSDDDRVWLRYNDDTDAPFGATVFDLRGYWNERRSELAHLIAKFLGLASSDVETRIAMALD